MASHQAQLTLFADPTPTAAAPRDCVFARRPSIDRTGLSAYLHLIRDAGDPDRCAARGPDNHNRSPHLGFKRVPVATWKEAILALLQDDRPRTFNAITVELSGYNADVHYRQPADRALWALVDAGAVELTLDTPILFRLAR
jgi:hypothetical protein